MRRILTLALTLTMAQAAMAQATIDRVVAVVNKRVITQSEWDEQARYEALVNGTAPETVQFTKESLERLVDLQLMREQLEYVRFEALTPEQQAEQVKAVRQQVAPNASDEQWRALLARYKLSEDEFATRVAAQVDVMRFVDLRFRPSVHVDTEKVEKYYAESLVPELMKKGSAKEQVPPLNEVEPKIRAILSEQQLNDMLKQWLTGLRAQGRIKLMATAKAPTGD